MTDLRITPGPWTISGSIYDPNLVHAAIWADGESQYPTVASVMTGPHAAANAEFIAEAGTVAHETGLTPRELLDQRDAAQNAHRRALEELEKTKAELAEVKAFAEKFYD